MICIAGLPVVSTRRIFVQHNLVFVFCFFFSRILVKTLREPHMLPTGENKRERERKSKLKNKEKEGLIKFT